jgi:hypothetical protein
VPRQAINFETVRDLARDLADIEDGPSALKVRGTLLTFTPTHKSAEPGSLAVRISLDQRAELMSAAPGVYYVTDHYLNYPTMLVRLAHIQPDALKDLLRMAWYFATIRKPKRSKRP